MARQRALWAAALSLVPAAAGLAVTGALADTGASAAVSAAAATAGCGKAPGLASGPQAIQSGGKNRTFILKVPGDYDNTRSYRLIFAFHWWGGTANEVASGGTSGAPWAYYGQQELSDNSAILVAPQGIDNAWPNNGGEDVAFVDAMTSRIEAALCVDTTQRFATGFSYGGGLSYALACGRATVFRAVAVFSGAQLSGCDGGTRPVAYLGIHGVGDSVLNISQGRSLRDTFVRNNGCTPQNPREPAVGSQTHITTEYAGCRAGYPVVWAAFDGGHLPGAVDGCTCESGVRTWTKGEVWKFFSRFQGTSPNPTTTTTNTTASTIPQGARCQVAYRANAWSTGLTSEIVITNTGTWQYTGWALVFTLPSGQTITSGWNASYSPASGQVTARHVPYNLVIAPNVSVGIGFQATHNGDSGSPTYFTLNGVLCANA